jgi:hypothetical protein
LQFVISENCKNGSENPPQRWRTRQRFLARAIPLRRQVDAQSHGTMLAENKISFIKDCFRARSKNIVSRVTESRKVFGFLFAKC